MSRLFVLKLIEVVLAGMAAKAVANSSPDLLPSLLRLKSSEVRGDLMAAKVLANSSPDLV